MSTRKRSPAKFLISEITIEYITNAASYTETSRGQLPPFTPLHPSVLKTVGLSAPRRNIGTNPFICENYKYDVAYLRQKLYSYTDVIMFFYNQNRFLKYLGEMSGVRLALRKPSPAIIQKNIGIMLHMLFQCTVQQSAGRSLASLLEEYKLTLPKWSMQFTKAPDGARLSKIVWLNDTENNPTFANLIQAAKNYENNLFQTKETILTQLRQKLTSMQTYLKNNTIPQLKEVSETSTIFDVPKAYQSLVKLHSMIETKAKTISEQVYFKDFKETGKKKAETLVVMTKELQDERAVDTIKRQLLEFHEWMDDLGPSLSTLTSYTSFNRSRLDVWQKKTFVMTKPVYDLCTNYQKAGKITKTDIEQYMVTRESTQSSAQTDLKKTFPTYYKLMEEAFSLSQTFQLTPGQLTKIIQDGSGMEIEDGATSAAATSAAATSAAATSAATAEIGATTEETADSVNMGVLKYSTSDPNYSGYKMSIAVEMRPARDCDHYDLLMGSFMERRQNLQLIRYAPPYFLDEGGMSEESRVYGV